LHTATTTSDTSAWPRFSVARAGIPSRNWPRTCSKGSACPRRGWAALCPLGFVARYDLP
jgi:hypothetical protein